MKVIFLEDVAKVARKYDVKKVANGYARNFLVPNNLARIADKQSEKFIAEMTAKREAEKLAREAELQKMLGSLSEARITFTAKADKSGSLFAGISKEDISEKVEKDLNIPLHLENIFLDKPIKTLGTFDIEVGTEENRVEMKVEVERESE
ncbi:MAG TPA: 50S ribosomal protein L9 [Candidatus Paceibacterota bacterium]|nr:50S ribosomal protein L9 [Candidatus Paceibacterota bacterium]